MVNVAAINVLAELGTATWQSRQAVGYETALEGVSQVIGYYADLIAQEESAADPDLAAIEAWRGEQRAWAARGQVITPLDVKAIESVYDDAEELLSEDDDNADDDNAHDDDRG